MLMVYECANGLQATAVAPSVPVPSFGPRMVCNQCGMIGADAWPNWAERSERPSLTGVQWR